MSIMGNTKGYAMKRNKTQRMAEHNAIAARFPRGNTAGRDPLSGTKTLGNSFRAVNSLDFRVVKTGTMLPRKG